MKSTIRRCCPVILVRDNDKHPCSFAQGSTVCSTSGICKKLVTNVQVCENFGEMPCRYVEGQEPEQGRCNAWQQGDPVSS